MIAELIAVAIVLCSTGNYARISFNSIQYKSGFFIAAFYAFRSVGFYSFLWLTNPANILAAFLISPWLIKSLAKNIKVKMPLNRWVIFVFLLIALCSCMSVYFPEHYFESALPYPRVTTIFFFAAVHFFLLGSVLLYSKLYSIKYVKRVGGLATKYHSYITIAFFAVIFCSPNFLHVTKDLISGTAYHYSIESKQRFELLKNCKTDTCYVPMHKYWASSIENFKKEDLNTNPFIHIDKYFGKTILYEPVKSSQK